MKIIFFFLVIITGSTSFAADCGSTGNTCIVDEVGVASDNPSSSEAVRFRKFMIALSEFRQKEIGKLRKALHVRDVIITQVMGTQKTNKRFMELRLDIQLSIVHDVLTLMAKKVTHPYVAQLMIDSKDNPEGYPSAAIGEFRNRYVKFLKRSYPDEMKTIEALERVYLLKPMTFNESGPESVKEVKNRFNAELQKAARPKLLEFLRSLINTTYSDTTDKELFYPEMGRASYEDNMRNKLEKEIRAAWKCVSGLEQVQPGR